MSTIELDLARWQRLWHNLGAQAPEGSFEHLSELYAGSGRYYHDASHIHACLDTFDGLRGLAIEPLAVELAIWYHDAIYDPARQDNEARSAELAVGVLRTAGLQYRCDTVHGLIMATDHRQPATTPDQHLLVDIDLSILAASPVAYAAYARAVRLEYARFPDAIYIPGRMAVLKKFLQRPVIFTTDEGKARWEVQARANIQAEIGTLLVKP